MMVRVQRIEWVSPSSSEAILFLSDGQLSCSAFAHPCTVSVGERVKAPLIGFNCNEIERVTIEKPRFQKDESSFGYLVCGRTEEIDQPKIRVGGFLIEPDIPFPKDTMVGDWVIFSCVRLDYLG